jgi:hypothetical protein
MTIGRKDRPMGDAAMFDQESVGDLATLWSHGDGRRCVLACTASGWHLRIQQGRDTLQESTVADGQTAVALADEWGRAAVRAPSRP